MYEKIISLATPFFFTLIAIELLVGMLRGKNQYRLNDAVASIGLGVVSQVSGAFTRALKFGMYLLVYHLLSWQLWPDSTWWSLIAALLFYDFCYYWHHRWMHEVSLAWSAHVVHHSSEDYNLSTALRQTSTGALLGWIPYLPMAIIGVPPGVYLMVGLIDLLYQFWIHTEQIDRLGWFDRVFASPSNHRVHHAVNDRYIDRNYGGILIIWDRLFGSFEPEDPHDKPIYGTRAPLRSFNPFLANVEGYVRIWQTMRRTPRWADKIGLLWRRPGWLPEHLRADQPPWHLDQAIGNRFDPPANTFRQSYVLVQFALALGLAIHFGEVVNSNPAVIMLPYAAYITLSLVTVGLINECHRDARFYEVSRLCFTIVAAAVLCYGLGITSAAVFFVVVALCFCSALALLTGLPPNKRADPNPVSSE